MAKLSRIIVHWTAGGKEPNPHDLQAYHYLIDGEGLVRKGTYAPEDNEDCKDGRYAAHTGGGNTGSIGVAVCGMAGYNKNYKTKVKPEYAVSRSQMEKMFSFIARLCGKYNIPINKVITHAEFGLANPNTSSKGKIDISYIPHEDLSGIEECGDYIRNKVQWYKERLKLC